MSRDISPAISVTHDALALARVHAASFDEAWSEAFFGAMLQQPGVTALGVGDEAAHGFILVRCAADEAEILTFAVDPAYRGRGHGRALLQAAIVLMMAQKMRRCFLEVAEDNAAALAVYTRAGFKPCGTRKDYYQRADGKAHAIMMELQLHPESQCGSGAGR